MEFYIQIGHNMMSASRQLAKLWGGGGVILSPRDLNSRQLTRFSAEMLGLGAELLLDPQLYDPRADHKRLGSHSYWPKTYDTDMLFQEKFLLQILQDLHRLNLATGTRAMILPGLFAEEINDLWVSAHGMMITRGRDVSAGHPVLATLCLGVDSVRSFDQMQLLLSETETWEVDGYYVVATHPKQEYLVQDPLWLANILDLCAGLRLQRREVIVGYAGHQMLCLAAANVNAIAAGNWLNVRNFSTSRFDNPDDSDVSRRRVWYYCPNALSEYKLEFLDLAQQEGALELLAPTAGIENHFAPMLFSGAQPTSTSYGESESFLHYLDCLQQQSQSATRPSFQQALEFQETLLDSAENLARHLADAGILSQNRDFRECFDVNRAALARLSDSRGFVLERKWV